MLRSESANSGPPSPRPKSSRPLRYWVAFGLLAACVARGEASAAPKAATDTKGDISAERTTYDQATGEMVESGNARLVDEEVILTADEIRYNRQTDLVTAIGHVVMTRRSDRVLADRVRYHRSDGSFDAVNIRVGNYPFYISGETAEGSRTEITINDAKVIYREPGRWQPTVMARTIVYSPNHFLRIRRSHIGVGETRPLPVVRFRQDLSAPSALSFLTFDGGYRSTLGAYFNLGLLLPVEPGLSLGPDLGFYTNRGPMAGPIADYDWSSGDDTIKGLLRSGFIHDYYDDRSTDILGDPVPIDRSYVEWQYNQQVGDRLAITGDINWWSDSEIIRDFDPKNFFPVQEPDNYVEAVYSGDDYLASAFTRFQPSSFFPVQQRLPEVSFNYLPTALGGGFYERFDASAAYLKELPPKSPLLSEWIDQQAPLLAATSAEGPTQNLAEDRFDFFYGITRPFLIHDYLTVTPVVGARFTDYQATEGAELPGGTDRMLGEVGVDVELRTSGTFDYDNPNLEIDGLRHLLTPVLSYRYIPNSNTAAEYVPEIDRSTFTTALPILELGDMRAIDQIQGESVLRLGLNNTLQTRDDGYGSRDLIVFNLANDLRFGREVGERDLSDLHAAFSIMPAKWLELRLDQTFSSTNFGVRELNTNFKIHDGELWTVEFGSSFLPDNFGTYDIPGLGSFPVTGLNAYHVEAQVRVNDVYQVFTRIDYDGRINMFTNQVYGLYQKVGNTWIVEYAVTLTEGSLHDSHFGFNVGLQLVRF